MPPFCRSIQVALSPCSRSRLRSHRAWPKGTACVSRLGERAAGREIGKRGATGET
jgi:hypothetical protein